MVDALSPVKQAALAYALAARTVNRMRRCAKTRSLPRVCVIGRDAVDVDRSADRLAMWIDDERLDKRPGQSASPSAYVPSGRN